MSGTQRLTNLLELAAQGPAMRAALAEEVAELLTDWPADCPLEMRGPCEALLARAAREVDEDTKVRLRIRLYGDPQLAARILPREPQDKGLMECLRAGDDVIPRIARALGLPESTARQLLDDKGGHALAVACKTLGLPRAAYSSLALLIHNPGDIDSLYARLEVYDAVSAVEAARELRRWNQDSQAA